MDKRRRRIRMFCEKENLTELPSVYCKMIWPCSGDDANVKVCMEIRSRAGNAVRHKTTCTNSTHFLGRDERNGCKCDGARVVGEGSC